MWARLKIQSIQLNCFIQHNSRICSSDSRYKNYILRVSFGLYDYWISWEHFYSQVIVQFNTDVGLSQCSQKVCLIVQVDRTLCDLVEIWHAQCFWMVHLLRYHRWGERRFQNIYTAHFLTVLSLIMDKRAGLKSPQLHVITYYPSIHLSIYPSANF